MPGQAKVTSSHKPVPLAADEDSFSFTLPDGSVVVTAQPKGVLKLKLREILPAEMLADEEIKRIATALLSIRTIDGQPVLIHSYATFQALMNRFGSDTQLDTYMEKYLQFTNPAWGQMVTDVLEEAAKEGYSPAQIEERMREKFMEHELAKREKLKN